MKKKVGKTVGSEKQLGASIGASFVGKRAEQLSGLIEQQVVPVFNNIGIVVPVRSCSLIIMLDELTVASAADLARRLDQSHQLILQKIPALEKLKLLERKTDPADKRRKVFRLTTKGKKQVALLNQNAGVFEEAYETLNQELGFDVFDVLGRAIAALQAKPLVNRIDEIT